MDEIIHGGQSLKHSETSGIPISVLIFTLNEESHLPSCLDSVSWCDDVFVVDSNSTDKSEQICRERAVTFVRNSFQDMARQRNWALDTLPIKHQWVLMLDADERVPSELVAEMQNEIAEAPLELAAFRVSRRLHMWGRWLKHSSLYPTYIVRLIRRDRVRFIKIGHGEGENVDGVIRNLRTALVDENLRGIDEWFERQNRYSRKEAEYELQQHGGSGIFGNLLSKDPLFRRAGLKQLASSMPARGLWFFLYSYFWRRGFLDGRDGFVFCVMRSMYQTMIAIKKYDLKRSARPPTIVEAKPMVDDSDASSRSST